MSLVENEQVRRFAFSLNYTPQCLASVLSEFGNTHVITAVSSSEDVPSWMRGQKLHSGWLTAEYSLIPSATPYRQKRERGYLSGRTQEIQRLISRSLRAMLDLPAMPDRTFFADCDVISADGGTRTTALNGSTAALILAISRLMRAEKLHQNPIKHLIAGISVGYLGEGSYHVDPDYHHDSNCRADVTFILTESGEIIEVQGCAEKHTFSPKDLMNMMELAQQALVPVFERLREIYTEYIIEPGFDQ